MDESYEFMMYVKGQKSIEPWYCEICCINEIKLQVNSINEPPVYHEWEQYVLQCGHLVHPRCYYTWCFNRVEPGCNTCGIFFVKKSNIVCSYCWTCEHQSMNCPVGKMPYYIGHRQRFHEAMFYETLHED
jgi:hypothetical protein